MFIFSNTQPLSGLTCQQTDFDHTTHQRPQNVTKLFDFDVCFSYESGKKTVFFLLKMMDKLIVMSKSKDEILLHKEYENVHTFTTHVEGSSVKLRIDRTDETVLRDDLYRVTVDYPMAEKSRFGGVYATIENRVALAKAQLSTTKLDIQKYFLELGKELRFGPKTLHGVRFFCALFCVLKIVPIFFFKAIEERVMLAKYGDIWIRRHNDFLVFGVPVYNCCYLR